MSLPFFHGLPQFFLNQTPSCGGNQCTSADLSSCTLRLSQSNHDLRKSQTNTRQDECRWEYVSNCCISPNDILCPCDIMSKRHLCLRDIYAQETFMPKRHFVSKRHFMPMRHLCPSDIYDQKTFYVQQTFMPKTTFILPSYINKIEFATLSCLSEASRFHELLRVREEKNNHKMASRPWDLKRMKTTGLI